MDKTGNKYVKRTQKDYSMSFKLAVVQEYENTGISQMALQRKYGIQGNNTLKRWIEKYSNFDVSNKSRKPMEKSKDQELLELRQKVRLLERKNARLEKELEQKDMKAEFFELMIDIAEKEYNIDIRKTPFPNSHAIQRDEVREYKRSLPTARDKQAEILPAAVEYMQEPTEGYGSRGDGAGHPDGDASHRHP